MSERAARPDWATIPNAVTLLRLLLLVPVCVLLATGPGTLAVVLLLVWALTDWVDGALARALGQTSRTGEIIDPVADRLGLVGIALALMVAGLLPWPALVILFVVDALVAVVTTRTALDGGLGVSWIGKIRTAILMTGVLLLAALAAWAPEHVGIGRALVWIGVALHVAAGVGYLAKSLRGRR
ncbi:CDP-alcohol phosphatidyltransferase family protein [Brachybacterium huguangmaarense]